MDLRSGIGRHVPVAIAVVFAVGLGWYSDVLITATGPCIGDDDRPDVGSPADEFCWNGGMGIVWLLPVAIVGAGYLWQRRHTGVWARLWRGLLTGAAAIAANVAAMLVITNLSATRSP